MNLNKRGNREYKDSVFVTLFSDTKKVIELYNAIEGKDYGLLFYWKVCKANRSNGAMFKRYDSKERPHHYLGLARR